MITHTARQLKAKRKWDRSPMKANRSDVMNKAERQQGVKAKTYDLMLMVSVKALSTTLASLSLRRLFLNAENGSVRFACGHFIGRTRCPFLSCVR